MANPLYGQFGNQNQTNPMMQLIQDARQLKQTFQGDPRQTVQQLVASGRMSQQDFNRYAQIANQLIGSGVFK